MLNRSTTKLNLFVFSLTFLIYLFLGAQLFSTIERPAEQIIINEMSKTRQDFLEKYPCVKGLNEEFYSFNCDSFFFSLQKMILNHLLLHYLRQINMESMHEQILQRKNELSNIYSQLVLFFHIV